MNYRKDKYNNDIPGEIQKYLNIPNEDMKFIKHTEETKFNEPVEVPSIFSIPDVVTIEEPKVDESTQVKENSDNFNINPFQTTNYSVVDRLPINNYSNVYNEIVEDSFNVKEENNDKPEPDKSLITVINKVREYIGSLGEYSNIINTSEIDLDDKYQIVIEIKKNN